jgi:hypothetical protein
VKRINPKMKVEFWAAWQKLEKSLEEEKKIVDLV